MAPRQAVCCILRGPSVPMLLRYAMAPEALALDDPRVEHHFVDVGNDIRYHYRLARPVDRAARATVLLLHGWPDLAHGWRFQIPPLLSQGLQVIIPDMLGYGQTSAPDAADEYSLKNMSDHMSHIVRCVTPLPVIVGAHDWGAFLAWRLAMYHASQVRAIFCFSIPFMPPRPDMSHSSLQDLVKANPVLTYQLQNAGPEAETLAQKSPAHLRGFLHAMFGGVTADGLPGFDPYHGLFPDRLLALHPSPLMTPDVLEHYVSEFSRTGLHGPMNWYRTRSINAQDDMVLAKEKPGFAFSVPAMIVMAGQDVALPPALADNQHTFFTGLLQRPVVDEASHWILIECPDKCNGLIRDFVNIVLGGET